jgi:hypothetical protein
MKKRRFMTCAEFTAQMAQLVACGEDIFAHPHVKRCRVHRALLEDLETIARAAQQLFPAVDPSDKVWANIEQEIAPSGWLQQRISDPFPGCHFVFRTKVMDNWNSEESPVAYDDHLGVRILPVPATRIRAAGHESPPHPTEGR